jgi:hypothetical protein
MLAANFWEFLRDPVAPSIDFESDTPPSLITSALGHPPSYYLLQALAQRLVSSDSVEAQLYLARFVSALLNLVVVASAYGLTREAFPGRRWLPAAVATFIALLPPFTDLMSAVNNDAGAAAAASVFLWASVRLIRRGPSLGRIAAVLLLALLCVVTKRTASIVAISVLLALVAGYVYRRHSRWFWIGLPIAGGVALILTFTWGRQAAHWYNVPLPAPASRVQVDTPLGNWAVSLSTDDDSSHPREIYQELAVPDTHPLQGHVLTLGAWIKSAEGSQELITLSLDDGRIEKVQLLEAAAEWQFHAITTTVSAEARGLAVRCTHSSSEDGARTVHLDGLVLVDGEMPTNVLPEFKTAQAIEGQWDGQEFTNLLQNGSAESSWPSLRPWTQDLHAFRTPISLLVHSILDWPRTSWVYRPHLLNLFRSFWGHFAWGHPFLPSAYFYPLGLLSLLSILGIGIGLVRLRRAGSDREPWQLHVYGVLGFSLLAAWGATILRIHPAFAIDRHFYWPFSRHACVVIIPTALFLLFGLTEILPRRWLREAAWLGVLGLLTLDAVAIWTVILPFYYG